MPPLNHKPAHDGTLIPNRPYSPKYTIEDAVRELCHAFKRGELPDSFSDDAYFNVKRLQRLKAA